jgi:hypothetical protein
LDALFAAIVAVFPTKKYTPEITETRNSVSLLAIEHQRSVGNIIAAKPLFSVNGYLFPLVSAIYTTKSRRSQSVGELFIYRRVDQIHKYAPPLQGFFVPSSIPATTE